MKAPSSAPVAAGNTAMRALPAKNPCWRLTACPCFPLRFFGAGTFSTAATTRLLSGLAVLRPGLVGSPRPPMKSLPPRKRGSRPLPASRAADVRGPRSARGATCAPWSRPSGTPHRVPAAETSPRRHACHGPSDRRRETTWSDRSAFGETLFQRSPIPAGGRSHIRTPVDASSAAKRGVRRTRRRQIRRASGAPPNVRCTSPRYQIGQQTLAAQPLTPLSDRLGYATLTRSSGPEHFMNLPHLDREITPTSSSWLNLVERFFRDLTDFIT